MISGLKVEVTRIGGSLSCRCSRIEAAVVSVSRKDVIPDVAIQRVGLPLQVECRLIEFSGDAYYLRVSPEVIWLIPDNGFSEEVKVRSNVKWRIE